MVVSRNPIPSISPASNKGRPFPGYFRMDLFSELFLFSLFAFLFTINYAGSQPLGNGKDGSPAISGIVNIYTSALSDIKRCEKKIPVKENSGFSAGDLILIMQMQGAIINNSNTPAYGTITDYSNAGNYEFAMIDSIGNGNEIFLEKPVLRNFSFNGKVQIIRVPQYVNPIISGTLTCKKWDGETGGVLVLDARDTLRFNANINVNGKGFRGGQKLKGSHFFAYSHDFTGESFDPDMYSLKGEGIAFYGVFPFTSGRGAPANGGGGGNIHTAGGGGGSNFGCGGKGGWGYPVSPSGSQYDCQGIGGYALNYSHAENKIFLGGGGGAGHEHFNNGTSGEAGGGMVIITANHISGNSKKILANGNNSANSGAYGDGTGGGGAGGTILLYAGNFTDTLQVSAKGGNGGSSIGQGFGPGGGGGGGIIWLSTMNLPAELAASPLSGGTAGLAGGVPYGADNGCSGDVFFDLKIPFNNYYDGVKAGFTFSPSFISPGNTSISFNNTSTGADNYQWTFGDGGTDNAANPVHSYSGIMDYQIMLVAEDSICADTLKRNIPGEFSPNIFTPNGDGVNDYFNFSSLDSVLDADLTIFNRWGVLVFYKYALGKTGELHWDGRLEGIPLPEGTYFFVVTYTTGSGEKKNAKGSVTLLR